VEPLRRLQQTVPEMVDTKWLVLSILFSVGPALTASANDLPASSSACFSVIAGRPDVPPAAPMLLDGCTGETFVLRRSLGHSGRYEWVALAKGNATAAKASERVLPSKPPQVGKIGCFTYNARSYCP
jgi:hypothetical protein